MKLSGKQIKHLRGQAHHRQVVVSIGNNGLSDAVLAELEQALDTHELLKIKLPTGSRGEKKRLMDTLCDKTGATAVQLIGRVAVLFRPLEDSGISLP